MFHRFDVISFMVLKICQKHLVMSPLFACHCHISHSKSPYKWPNNFFKNRILSISFACGLCVCVCVYHLHFETINTFISRKLFFWFSLSIYSSTCPSVLFSFPCFFVLLVELKLAKQKRKSLRIFFVFVIRINTEWNSQIRFQSDDLRF